MKIDLIGAARPNFMKIAPLYNVLKDDKRFDVRVVHTGQHYDKNMSEAFFNDLNLKVDVFLNVRGKTHAEQVANTMIEYEKVVLSDKPDLVIVVGDVNATMACTIVAKKLHIKVAHLEAGIRSFDMSMPEEVNRKVTDSICDYYWTPSIDANENLVREGIESKKIKLVGNIMIDSFKMKEDDIKNNLFYKNLGLEKQKYAVATFHRVSNVDNKENLLNIIEVFKTISKNIKVVFPIHPRTKNNLIKFDLLDKLKSISNVILLEPLGYIDFMNLVVYSKFIITDSGGIQEETTYLQIPCLTFRENTERPITVIEGTNTLVNFDNYKNYFEQIMEGEYKQGNIPVYWDGHTAKRIKKILLNL